MGDLDLSCQRLALQLRLAAVAPVDAESIRAIATGKQQRPRKRVTRIGRAAAVIAGERYECAERLEVSIVVRDGYLVAFGAGLAQIVELRRRQIVSAGEQADLYAEAAVFAVDRAHEHIIVIYLHEQPCGTQAGYRDWRGGIRSAVARAGYSSGSGRRWLELGGFQTVGAGPRWRRRNRIKNTSRSGLADQHRGNHK